MLKKKSTTPLPSPGEVGQIYRQQLGSLKNNEYKYNKVINEHELLQDGSVKRSVSALIEALEDGVEEFFWRVPLISEESRVAGIRVSTNGKVHGYGSRAEGRIHEIIVQSEKLMKGEKVHVELEYYVTKACRIREKSLLYYELDYSFAYKPVSTTESFELRLHVPKDARMKVDTNLPTPESFIVGENQLVIATEEEFQEGDVVGSIQVKYRSPYFVPVFSVVISILFSAVLALIQHGQTVFGGWYLVIVAALFFITSIISMKILRID